jgi:hypothetical protein
MDRDNSDSMKDDQDENSWILLEEENDFNLIWNK